MTEILPGIQMQVCPDRMSATLVCAPGSDKGIDTNTIIGALEGQGLNRATIDSAACAAVLDAARGAGLSEGVVVARGTPVTPGGDAQVRIEPALAERLDRQRGLLTSRPVETSAPAKRGADDSHYEVDALCIVCEGQLLGNFHETRLGADGVDIFGTVLQAREGRAVTLALDGVQQNDDGSLLATRSGLLLVDGGKVCVALELALPGSIDFTTGHVRFPGSVRVAGGVRDNFQVWAGIDLEIGDLVEAGVLVAARDIDLRRGMAGRGKGRVECARDLRAKYLDGVAGKIGRDLFVERELKACTLEVGRRVESPRSSLLNGEVAAADSVELAEIGSGARARARVCAGHSPRVEEVAHELLLLAPRVLAEVAGAEQRLAQLRSIGGKMTRIQAEELTELEFLVATSRAKMEPIARSLLRARGVLTARRAAGVRVHKRLHAGVRVCVGGVEGVIHESIAGPLWVGCRSGGEVVVRDERTGSEVPLASVAAVQPAPGAVRLQEITSVCETLAPGLAARLEPDDPAALGDNGPVGPLAKHAA